MRHDIICCDCGVTKLGEVVFDENMSEQEGAARARDMGRCPGCQSLLEASEAEFQQSTEEQ